jgi:hypothetical protein
MFPTMLDQFSRLLVQQCNLLVAGNLTGLLMAGAETVI